MSVLTGGYSGFGSFYSLPYRRSSTSTTRSRRFTVLDGVEGGSADVSWLAGAGEPFPFVLGEVRVPARVVASTNVGVIVEEQYLITRNGDQLQSTQAVDATVQIFATLGISLDETANWTLLRLYADDELILDFHPDSASQFKYEQLDYRFYDGNSSQEKPSELVSIFGATNVNAYRGRLCVYLDFQSLIPWGGNVPQKIEAVIASDAGDGPATTDYTLVNTAADHAVAYDQGRGVTWGLENAGSTVHGYDISTETEVQAQEVAFSTELPKVGNFTTRPLFNARHDLLFVATSDSSTGKCFLYAIQPTTGYVLPPVADGVGGWDGGGCSANAALSITTYDAVNLAVQEFNGELLVGVTCLNIGSQLSIHRYTPGFGFDRNGVAVISGVDAPLFPGAKNSGKFYTGDTTALKEIDWPSDISVETTVTSSTVYTASDEIVDGLFSADGTTCWLYLQNGKMESVDVATWTQNWLSSAMESVSVGNAENVGLSASVTNDRTFGIHDTNQIHTIDLGTGTVTTTAIIISAAAARDTWNDDRQRLHWASGSVIRDILFDQINPGPFSLQTVIEAVGEFTGYDSGVVSASDLSGVMVNGVVLATQVQFQSFLQTMAQAFDFEVIDWNSGNITCQRQASDGSYAIDVALTETDIVSGQSDYQQLVTATIAEESSVPRSVSIEFLDPEKKHTFSSPAPARVPRFPIGPSRSDGIDESRIPIVMDADDVAELQYRKLFNLQNGRWTYVLTVSREHLAIMPGDIISFPVGGITAVGLVVAAQMQRDHKQTLTCRGLSKAKALNITADSGGVVNEQTLQTKRGLYIHLDMPLLRVADDAGGVALVQYGVGVGELVNRNPVRVDVYKADDFSSYNFAFTTANAPVFGVCNNALGSWTHLTGTQTSASLTFTLVDGDSSELASITEAQRLNDGNAFAYGRPGRWEVCNFQTVTDNSDGTYTVSIIDRGQRGTEQNAGSHLVGDYFVLLTDRTDFNATGYPLIALDAEYGFKALGDNATLSGTSATVETISGVAEKPWAPVHLEAAYSGSDIVIDWERRDRLNTGDVAAQPPMSEADERYRLRIYDNASPQAVARTVTVSSATTYTYDSADISTDFGSPPPTSLTFDVAQIATIDGSDFYGYVDSLTTSV